MKKIILSGEIGGDITADLVRKELNAAGGEPIEIDINSPGGSVFAGLEIRRMIAEYPGEVHCRLMLAASMASAIGIAGNKISVFEDSVFMMHSVSGLTAGSGKAHRETAEVLENLDRMLAGHYARKSGKPVSEIVQMMENETWLYGRDIVNAGFADTLILEKSGTNKSEAAAMTSAQYRYAACAQHTKAAVDLEALNRIMSAEKHTNTLSTSASQKDRAGVVDSLYNSLINQNGRRK